MGEPIQPTSGCGRRREDSTLASLHKHPKSSNWSIKFRFGGTTIYKSLRTDDEKEAQRLRLQIERTVADIERGRLVVPDDADLWQFILSDGKLSQKPTAPTRPVTLADLMDAYFAGQVGQKEQNTLVTEGIHRGHFERLLGGDKPLRGFTAADIQGYIRDRAREEVRPATIKKEVATLRMLLYRAEKLVGCKPDKDVREMFRALDFPKGKEQPQFMTWGEIEARIARTNPDKAARKALWDCLFLDTAQVTDFLDWADAKKARHPVPFFVPLLTAAHTGARVSELIRSRVDDWDFDGGVVVLREKKKSQKSETYRRVDLSERLVRVMRAWFADGHPGGSFAFCREADVPLCGKNLRNVFDRFVGRHKWSVLKGFHVFRHSFASNLARAGVDERVVDQLMGHQTEAMRKRYRHLFPEQRLDAVRKLFGHAPPTAGSPTTPAGYGGTAPPAAVPPSGAA